MGYCVCRVVPSDWFSFPVGNCFIGFVVVGIDSSFRWSVAFCSLGIFAAEFFFYIVSSNRKVISLVFKCGIRDHGIRQLDIFNVL